MTKKQLLENLNKTDEKTLYNKSFKVIASFDLKRLDLKSKYLHVLVTNQHNEPETYLVYRLDNNFLVNAFNIDYSRISARVLRQYEKAIETNKE